MFPKPWEYQAVPHRSYVSEGISAWKGHDPTLTVVRTDVFLYTPDAMFFKLYIKNAVPFSSWCFPCSLWNAVMLQFKRKFPEEGFRITKLFIGLSTQTGANLNKRSLVTEVAKEDVAQVFSPIKISNTLGSQWEQWRWLEMVSTKAEKNP